MNIIKYATIMIAVFLDTLIFAYPREDSKPLISGDSFRCMADHIYDEMSSLDPQTVKTGDIIFINLSHMGDFFQNIHPQIQVPYILISHNHEYSAPGDYRYMLDDRKLVAWFTQNPDIIGHPKLIPIPIGLSNKHWDHSRRHDVFILDKQKLLQKNIQKQYLLYVNFDWKTNPAVRRPVYDFFKQLPFCSWSANRPYKEYLKELLQAKFVLSPHGNGLDCHRTWEALYMGSFPLVKTSTMDPIYEGLPVLIIQDWTDVNPEFLENKYIEMKNKKYNLEKLYFNYWEEKIRDAQNECRIAASVDLLNMHHKLSEISQLAQAGTISSALAIIQELLEGMCPQEKRTALLKQRMNQAQLEMAFKIQEKGSKTAPFLSFIIPCYNRETVIRETINSIYTQNLTVPFEIIAIDDNSQDRSYEILQEYEELYNNFFAFKNSINQKAPTTRNNAICYSRGAYICNADSDDVFEPDSIQLMFDAMLAGGYDLAFFQNLRFFNDQSPSTYHVASAYPLNNEILLLPMLKERYISVAAGNRIYSKESWLQSGGYLEDVGHDSWSFSYKQLANGYKGYVHPGSSYRHRTWSDESNMWYEENRKNIHDISPQKVMLESPELFTGNSLKTIANYKPKNSEFMEFIAHKMNKQELKLVKYSDYLLKGRFAENKGDIRSALQHYLQAIEQDPLIHPTIYLRALRIAIELNNKSITLSLIDKFSSTQNKEN